MYMYVYSLVNMGHVVPEKEVEDVKDRWTPGTL